MNTTAKNATPSSEKDGKSAPFVHLTVRIPAQVRAQFQSEADRRCEDLATTVRRHLYQSLTSDQTDARLEALSRKLDALLTRDAGESAAGAKEQLENLTQAALDLERRLNESLAGQKHIQARMDEMAEAYKEIFDYVKES